MAAILCPRCHKIVNAEAETCPHCGQRKPGLWGATATIRKLGLQLNFPHLITVFCGVLYLLALLLDPSAIFPDAGPAADSLAESRSQHQARRYRHPTCHLRLVVDSHYRHLPTRRPAAHLLQHDVGASAWSGCRKNSSAPSASLRSLRSLASPALSPRPSQATLLRWVPPARSSASWPRPSPTVGAPVPSFLLGNFSSGRSCFSSWALLCPASITGHTAAASSAGTQPHTSSAAVQSARA